MTSINDNNRNLEMQSINFLLYNKIKKILVNAKPRVKFLFIGKNNEKYEFTIDKVMKPKR